ncbi:MAG: hypothetical protein Q4B70_10145 [Lachnospiraceae bacterium]|nr:hypothetical protein [Lachnospiraceae bacterium]
MMIHNNVKKGFVNAINGLEYELTVYPIVLTILGSIYLLVLFYKTMGDGISIATEDGFVNIISLLIGLLLLVPLYRLYQCLANMFFGNLIKNEDSVASSGENIAGGILAIAGYALIVSIDFLCIFYAM